MRFFLVAALLTMIPATPYAADPIRVTVLHTNDVHGWIMARRDAEGRLVGGAPALAAAVAKERGPRLLLDAGDWWQGTPEGSLSKGAAAAEVFNALGYDAIAVGNHEFDDGQDSLRKLIELMRVPVLSANIHRKGTQARVDWVRPWLIKEVAGVRFGIFGLVTTDMGRLAFPQNIAGLSFRREVDAAREAVRALREAGAEVIIAVTHVGMRRPGQKAFEDDETIAHEVEGIDLIVGGHSHSELRPAVYEERHGTLIVQAGSYLTQFGRVLLDIDPETRRVVAKSDELVALSPENGVDPQVQAIVDRHAKAVGKAFDVVVATATAPLTRGLRGESGLGGWMTDCYREHTHADVAVQNGGGIRSDINAGPVTVRSLFNVMPFDNRLVRLRMKGRLIRDVLDHAVGHTRTGQFSGAKVEFREAAPAGERLVSAAVGDSSLDDEASYSVATIDFMVAGGDHYPGFERAEETKPLGLLAREALIDCAKRQGTIAPPPAGRMKAK